MEYLLDSLGAKLHNFDAILECIDKQMLDTDRELEDCIRDIYRNELAEVNLSDSQKANPADITNVFLNSRVLEKGCCTKTEKFAALFQQLVALLESKPGLEDDVLAFVLEQTATEGLALRFQCSVPQDISHSVLSLNAVVDHAEQDHEDVWYSLCYRLSKRYVRRLETCFANSTDIFTDIQMKERLHCIHNLSILHSSEEVLKICRSVTQKILANLSISWQNEGHSTSHKSKGKSGTAIVSFSKAVERFDVLVSNVSKLIEEDMILLVRGVYGDFTSGVQVIKELYLDHLSADVSSLLDMFETEINAAISNGKQSKMTKSFSEGSFPKTSQSLFKAHGSSNIFTDEVDVKESNAINSCVESLVKLLSSVERVDVVLHSLCVQFVGLREVKVRTTGRPRRSLKSALKRSTDDLMASKRSATISVTSDSPPLAERRDTIESISMPTTDANASGRISDLLKWEWGKEFQQVSALITQAIGVHVTQLWRSNILPQLEADLTNAASNSVVLSNNADDNLRGISRYKPRKVLKCIERYVRLLSDLAVVAKAGHEGPLVAAKTAFLSSFIDCQEKLVEIFEKHSQKKMSVMSMYVLLSSAVLVETSLVEVGRLLDSSDIQDFTTSTQRWTQYASLMKTKIIDKHKMLMCTSILCDSESHHWSGDKEFYEGERCSYSVQMWHTHLSGLRHDLQQVCPPNVARFIFISVLRDSLVTLATRYADACPTYRRLPQFRADITTILLCTAEHLLTGCCESVDQLTDPSPSDSDVYVVHSCCASLHATLVVVSSPLDELCRVFKRGFAKRQSSGSSQKGGDKIASGQMSLWLSTVWFNIVPRSHFSYSQLRTESAVYLQLKILNAQQHSYEPEKLLFTLLMKNQALPTMVCSQLAADWSEDDSENLERGRAYFKLFSAFVTVFCRSEVNQFALSLSFMPAFKRSETLQWFEMDARTSSKHKLITPWISAIVEEMSLYCLSIVESSVQRMMKYSERRQVNIAHMLHCDSQLPCGCIVSSRPMQAEDVVGECLQDILHELPSWVLGLPATLMVLCHNIEEYFLSTNAWPHPYGMVILKLISASVERMLCDSGLLQELLLLNNLTEEAGSMLKLLAQCIISLLSSSPVDTSLLPSVAGNFVRRNRGWIKKQLQDTVDCFKAEVDHVNGGEDMFDDMSTEFVSSKMTVSIQLLLADVRGQGALLLLHDLLINNIRWITDYLDIRLPLPLSPSDAAARQTHLCLPPYQSVAKQHRGFNPLHSATHIGECSFDQEALMNFQFSWPELLRSDLGLTEIGFRRLLFNRHEMLKDASLDDNEKKLVDALKNCYDVD